MLKSKVDQAKENFAKSHKELMEIYYSIALRLQTESKRGSVSAEEVAKVEEIQAMMIEAGVSKMSLQVIDRAIYK
jgi:hypothetical protein